MRVMSVNSNNYNSQNQSHFQGIKRGGIIKIEGLPDAAKIINKDSEANLLGRTNFRANLMIIIVTKLILGFKKSKFIGEKSAEQFLNCINKIVNINEIRDFAFKKGFLNLSFDKNKIIFTNIDTNVNPRERRPDFKIAIELGVNNKTDIRWAEGVNTAEKTYLENFED